MSALPPLSRASVAPAGVAAQPRSTTPRRRALGDGLILGGLAFAAYLFVVVAPVARTFGFDAFAYWSVDLGHPYAETAGALGAFTYSPVLARLFAPSSGLAWLTFVWLWTAVLVGTVIFLGRREPRVVLAILAFPPVALELYHGNVHLLIAAVIVLGFRAPALWSLAILAKVTPAVGLVWFGVRREWRPLAIAVGATAALVAISLAVDGRLWVEWITDSLGRTASGAPLNQASVPIPLWVRLPVAIAIVGWGGRTNRRWTIAVGVTLALPVLWPTGFAVLAAIPWLLEMDRRAAADAARTAGPEPILEPSRVARFPVPGRRS